MKTLAKYYIPLGGTAKKQAPLIHFPPQNPEPTHKAKPQAKSSHKSDYDRASQSTLSTIYDDSSDQESIYSNESKPSTARIVKVFTPKVKAEPEEKSNSLWAAPIKKSNKNKAESSQPSKTVVVKSEDKATMKQQRELQERVTRSMETEDYKQLDAYAQEMFLQNGSLPSYTDVLLDQADIEEFVDKKVICANSKAYFFSKSEPAFGYPLLIKSEKNGQYVPSIILEYFSFSSLPKILKSEIESPEEQYVMKKLTTKKGLEYQYWLPLYLGEEHFEAIQTYAKNILARISSGKDHVQEFHPRMVLEVLLPILHRAACQIAEDRKSVFYALEVFSQVFMLAKRLLDDYPEFLQTIDAEIESSLKHKEISSIEEILLKALFSKVELKELDQLIFSEYLKKNVEQVMNNGITSIKENSTSFLSNILVFLSQMSQSLIVLRELVSLFKRAGVVKELVESYGFLSECTIKTFAARMDAFIVKEDDKFINWRAFVEGFGVEKGISSLKDLVKSILSSC